MLGDFAALGYDPVTPLEKVTALSHASFTRGNTDRYVVTQDLPVPPEKALQDPALLPEVIEAVRSFSWTRGYVSAAGWLDWLMNVPLEVRLTLRLAQHGSFLLFVSLVSIVSIVSLVSLVSAMKKG